MQINIISILLCALLTLPTVNGQSREREPVYNQSESLKFQMHYGPINAGEMTISLKPSSLDGREVLHAEAKAYTTGLADRLYKIYDVYESFMDPETGLPVKAIRNISEGNYRYYNEVVYDRDSNRVESLLSGVHEVPPGIMDMLSVIYELRSTLGSTRLRSGDIIELKTFFSDEIYPVIIRYRGTETVRTRKGKFHALKFSPVSEPGRVFKTEDDITIWFSNDRNFVPLRISLNMLVGSVNIDLIETSGLRYDLRNLK